MNNEYTSPHPPPKEGEKTKRRVRHAELVSASPSNKEIAEQVRNDESFNL
jgi:hypothetical protein